MLRLFLSTHGTMASGMLKAIEILAGGSDKLTVFDAYVDDRLLSDSLDEFFMKFKDDQKVLLSDLYGGSVNQKMYTYLDEPNTYLIAGVNLALVLELVMTDNVNEQFLSHLVEDSRKMIRLVHQNDIVTQDDDFF